MNVWPQESSKSDVRAKKVVIILRSKDYVLNKKIKITHQNSPMAKFERFCSWMVKIFWFRSWMAKTKLSLQLDGQKWSFF
jgi:hypothetical protein